MSKFMTYYNCCKAPCARGCWPIFVWMITKCKNTWIRNPRYMGGPASNKMLRLNSLTSFLKKRKTIFSQLNLLTSGFLNPWLLKRKNVLMLVKIKKKLSISTRQLLLLELSDVQLSFICSGNCHCLNLQTKSIINSYKLILLPTWDFYRSVQRTDQSGFPQMCQKWSASQSAPENDSLRH